MRIIAAAIAFTGVTTVLVAGYVRRLTDQVLRALDDKADEREVRELRAELDTFRALREFRSDTAPVAPIKAV